MRTRILKFKPLAGESKEIPLTDEDCAACEWLRKAIERLSASAPMWSRSAYTHRYTRHIVFSTGNHRQEGEIVPWWDGNVLKCAEMTFEAVREYRDRILGPVDLVWRCEPEVTRSEAGVRLYARLCFEPHLRPHAKFDGVWVQVGADPCGED